MNTTSYGAYGGNFWEYLTIRGNTYHRFKFLRNDVIVNDVLFLIPSTIFEGEVITYDRK